jgi:hypothetical protein
MPCRIRALKNGVCIQHAHHIRGDLPGSASILGSFSNPFFKRRDRTSKLKLHHNLVGEGLKRICLTRCQTIRPRFCVDHTQRADSQPRGGLQPGARIKADVRPLGNKRVFSSSRVNRQVGDYEQARPP